MSSKENKSPLSPTETAVLVQAGKGHSVKQIARLLICSQSTASNHLASIYTKLGLNNRNAVSAIVIALKQGYITLEDL